MTPRARSTRTEHVDGVLVVGGGYAGLHAARAAADAGAPVTVLNPTARHDFVTRLAAVAGRAAPEADADRDLATFGHRVMIGTVVALRDGEVTLADGTRRTADAVVFCVGAGVSAPRIAGIEHALPLRTAFDALAIRSRLDRGRAVTIIGGGATGVQLAGAISASRAAAVVRIVEAESELLATMSRESSDGASRILRDRGVQVLLGANVERITGDGVVIDGEVLDGLVVWAGGFVPRTAGLDVEVDDTGRVVVDDHLRITGMTRTFAAGDVAAHVTGDGSPLPMSAQIAVQAGEAAGENAARVVTGRDLQEVTLSHRGWVLDLSGHRGIAEVAGITLAGPFADLIPPFLHEAIDLKTLFGMAGFDAFTC